jgi:hypothetical protein
MAWMLGELIRTILAGFTFTLKYTSVPKIDKYISKVAYADFL